MTKEEMKVLRMNLLGGMNAYILDAVGDDEVTETWLALCVPDEATEEDLAEIAEDDDQWTYICKMFGHLVRDEYTTGK